MTENQPKRNPKAQAPRQGKAPAGKSPAKKPPGKRIKVSRLGYYVIILGWLTIAVNYLLAFEWVDPTFLIGHFFSADPATIGFRALAFLLPFIFTILGYMVYEREKLLWRAMAAGKKLESQKLSLQADYKRLTAKLTEKDEGSVSEYAQALINDTHRLARSNCEMVAAFSEFQAKNTIGDVPADQMREIQRRLRTIASLHDLFAKSGATSLKASDYLRLVANDTAEAIAPGLAKLKLELAPVPLDPDSALACGMIMSELVSNSLRFAFEDVEDPEIRVSFGDGGEGNMFFTVADNGNGMPEGMDIAMLETLGLKIVEKFIKQLKGTFEFIISDGTTIDIRFPLKKAGGY